LEDFSQDILLAGPGHYGELFAQLHGVEVHGRVRPMRSTTADGVT